MILIAVLLLSGMLSLVSCADPRVESVDRENLFVLNIGRLEDQLDLFGLEGTRSVRKTRVAMRDGIFYLSDGNGAKVVRYTSYGDLLSMIYNTDANPPPLSLQTEVGSDEVVTRQAVAYPLGEPGELAVDSRKHLYVEDRLPAERRNFDVEHRTLLDTTILHFDEDGRFVEYLGQEGIGGTPFPRVYGICASAQDELAVLCRLTTGWNVYWFDRQGTALFLVHIQNEDIPVTQDRKSRPSLDSIQVSPDSRRIYLKVDYYLDTFDESTKTKSGIEYDGSVVWVMDVEDGSYQQSVEIPPFEQIVTENDKKVETRLIYSLIGAARGGKLFLSVPSPGGYSLLLLELDSTDQKRGFIQVSDDELRFNAFHLSGDGILSGILATDYEVKVVWWRTDRFMGEVRR
jgi:hypothetical protein